MLRDFQVRAKQEIYAAWKEPNVFNITAVLPTGAGKTVLFCDIISEFDRPTVAIAHRQELVSQMSLALNREKVKHGIIAPKAVQRQIIGLHHATHGYSMYSYRSPVRVAGVDTLLGHDAKDRWLSQVELAVHDEAHHVLRENKWGSAQAMFPRARMLGVTAHALRADGLGLGRHADGLVDKLVIGPSCRELIDRGYLTDYRVVCPESDIDFSHVPISSTGDYSLPKLRAVTHQSSRIVGDIVECYLKYAAGKLGVTFAVDIEAAKDLAKAYQKAGVPAEIITAKTPIAVRGKFMQQFRARRLLQLISVDCLGEGVDVPAIEVISMGRKTASFQLYAQQFGRALRIMVSDDDNARWDSFDEADRRARIAASIKPRALIIDHVGNVPYHRLPDPPRLYSLDRAERRSRPTSDAIPLRVCPKCLSPYERIFSQCPFCGTIPTPAGRATPEQVEGDLVELDAAVLAAMRGEVVRIDGPARIPKNVGPEVAGAITKKHRERQAGQATLRAAMALYGGWRLHVGEDERTAQKRFWYQFGVDVMTAKTLGVSDAAALEERIRAALKAANVVEQA